MKIDKKEALTRLVVGVVRLAAALIASIVFLMSRDIYGSPFSGCEVRGFFTLQPGCSSWPDFISGFGVVLLIAVIGGKKMHAKLIGLAIIVSIAMVGGLDAFQTGNYLYALRNPGETLFGLHWILSPLLLGGVVAYGILTFLPVLFRRSGSDRAP